MANQAEAAAHWDAPHVQGDGTRSWFEKPGMSVRMLDAAGVLAADAVIDVGGAFPLAGVLLDRGFRDLTVLDVSAAGMQYARDRLGPRADQVHWLTADVLSWHSRRHYRAWRDRAVYHFLTTDETSSNTCTPWTRPPPRRHRHIRLLRPGRAAVLLGAAGDPLQPAQHRLLPK